MWWQVFGSVAQILSAIGALTFGAASIFVAIAAKDLQIQQAHDSALGRTSQLLTKYFDNINSTGSQFRYGFYCIAHVDALAKQLGDQFDKTVAPKDAVALFSPEIANKSLLKSDDDLRNYDKCVSEFNKSPMIDTLLEDRIMTRFEFSLNTLENALFEWRNPNLPIDAKQQLVRELKLDACDFPVQTFFERNVDGKSERLRKIVQDYDNLGDFIKSNCPKQ